MSLVVFICPQGLGWGTPCVLYGHLFPPIYSNLFTWGSPRLPHRYLGSPPIGPVQTCCLGDPLPFTYLQVGGWPSTERPSFLVTRVAYEKAKSLCNS